jgi:hypothetical protein
MNNDYTHIAMIIDRSGSMFTAWPDVQGGYAEIVKTNKEAPGKCTFTVAAFDTEYDILEDFTDIQSVKDSLLVDPRGSTALLDAIGNTVTSVGQRLAAMNEEDRPAKVLVIVQTDGQENASNEYTAERVKQLIEDQTNKYGWQFQFIGADQASVTEATSRWGFNANNTSTYNSNNSKSAFTTLASKTRTMRAAPDAQTYACCAMFTESEKESLNSEKTSK